MYSKKLLKNIIYRVVHFRMFSALHIINFDVRKMVNEQLERIWKVAILTYLKYYRGSYEKRNRTLLKCSSNDNLFSKRDMRRASL
jgi:hypothetical protein